MVWSALCKGCGQRIEFWQTGSHKREWCSVECRRLHNGPRKNPSLKPTRATHAKTPETTANAERTTVCLKAVTWRRCQAYRKRLNVSAICSKALADACDELEQHPRSPICQACGQPLVCGAKAGRLRTSYCSEACERAARKKRAKLKAEEGRAIQCEVCGEPLVHHVTSGPRKRLCSDWCRYIYRRRNLPATIEVSCSRCGVTIGVPRGVGRKRKVCGPCRTQKERETDSICSLRKRARIKNAYVEDVGIAYLLERDKGRCQLCGRKASVSKVWPHPLSPTVDHIVPLSRGGKHEKKNVQLAHLRCNMQKGSKEGGVMLLIG